MKTKRASILSLMEERLLISKMSELRKQQIQSLLENQVLHDFLSCVSSENAITAYHDSETGDRIVWDPATGFSLNLCEDFFESSEKLQKAFDAVRSQFFECFLDEDDYAKLSSNQQPTITQRLEESIETEEEFTEDDAIDLLSKVSSLDANTLSDVEDETQADEFSNLSIDANLDKQVEELSKNVEYSPRETSMEGPTETSIAKSENIEDNVEESSSNENLDTSSELSSQTEIHGEDHGESNTEVTPKTIESEKESESAELQNEPSTKPKETAANETAESSENFEALSNQLAEVGMDKENIEALLSAVKSGKAPMETVQATIEKLRAEAEAEAEAE